MVLTRVFLEMLNAKFPSRGQHPGAELSFHVLPFQNTLRPRVSDDACGIRREGASVRELVLP